MILFYFLIVFLTFFPIYEHLTCQNLKVSNSSSNDLYLNPEEVSNLRGSTRFLRKRGKNNFFDPLNLRCSEGECKVIKGNFINEIPKRFCGKKCVENFENKKYWCFNTNTKKCEEHNYNYLEQAKNTCGEEWISQNPLPIYLEKKSCLKEEKGCSVLSKKECIKTPGCGYCKNSVGQGNCVRSTPEGPLDLELPCFPNRVKGGNEFITGRLNPFKDVTQKYN